MTWIALLFTTAFANPVELGTPDLLDGDLAGVIEDYNLVFPDDPEFHGIVNGTETTDYPNVVALGGLSNWGSYIWCTGTLIDPNWVLTAAHCIDNIDYVKSIGMTPYIIFGGDLYSNNGSTGVVEIQAGTSHPDYSYSQWEISNDIGIIELKTSATGVDLAVLNDETPDDSWVGEDLTAVGYGITHDDANDGGVKRTTDLAVQYWDSEVIYLYSPGTNLCSGDSGGATFENTNEGTLELAGVNSFVFGYDYQGYSCLGGGAGVVRVDQYIPWIQQYAPNVLLGGDGSGSNPGGGSGTGNASGEPEPDLDPGVVDTDLGDPKTPSKGEYPVGFRCDAAGTGGTLPIFLLIPASLLLLRRRRNA